MRVDHEIGIYSEDYERVLKWYSIAFSGKHPSPEDERVFMLFNIIYKDLLRAIAEEKAELDE